jgi:hypothetical protein
MPPNGHPGSNGGPLPHASRGIRISGERRQHRAGPVAAWLDIMAAQLNALRRSNVNFFR